LFALVGLQLSGILDSLGGFSTRELMWYGLLVTATVAATRFVWLPVLTYGPRWLSRRERERGPAAPMSHPIVISWAGMRGAVSLVDLRREGVINTDVERRLQRDLDLEDARLEI